MQEKADRRLWSPLNFINQANPKCWHFYVFDKLWSSGNVCPWYFEFSEVSQVLSWVVLPRLKVWGAKRRKHVVMWKELKIFSFWQPNVLFELRYQVTFPASLNKRNIFSNKQSAIKVSAHQLISLGNPIWPNCIIWQTIRWYEQSFVYISYFFCILNIPFHVESVDRGIEWAFVHFARNTNIFSSIGNFLTSTRCYFSPNTSFPTSFSME